MAQVLVGFDGSCPHSLEAVREEGANRFRILPSWRPSPGISEEAVGRSTRLGFRVRNDSAGSVEVELLIDWQYDDAPPKDRPSFKSREEFMSFRDFCVVREPGSEDWQTVLLEVKGSVAAFHLQAPPGTTEIHWHPPYKYTHYESFVHSLAQDSRVQTRKIGESEGGRNLWLLRITDESNMPKQPAFIRARVHAYESASSYNLEGMVRWLLGGSDWALQALRRFEFFILPMANPDGVANGLGRLTSPRGSNLVYVNQAPDAAHTAMKASIDEVRPKLFIDLHNWQNKSGDGLLGLDPELRDRFLHYMPDQVQHGKRWWIKDPSDYGQVKPETEMFGSYCRREFGSVTVTFEFPWFGRSCGDQRQTGADALRAILLSLWETGETWPRIDSPPLKRPS